MLSSSVKLFTEFYAPILVRILLFLAKVYYKRQHKVQVPLTVKGLKKLGRIGQ